MKPILKEESRYNTSKQRSSGVLNRSPFQRQWKEVWVTREAGRGTLLVPFLPSPKANLCPVLATCTRGPMLCWLGQHNWTVLDATPIQAAGHLSKRSFLLLFKVLTVQWSSQPLAFSGPGRKAFQGRWYIHFAHPGAASCSFPWYQVNSFLILNSQRDTCSPQGIFWAPRELVSKPYLVSLLTSCLLTSQHYTHCAWAFPPAWVFAV